MTGQSTHTEEIQRANCLSTDPNVKVPLGGWHGDGDTSIARINYTRTPLFRLLISGNGSKNLKYVEIIKEIPTIPISLRSSHFINTFDIFFFFFSNSLRNVPNISLIRRNFKYVKTKDPSFFSILPFH